MSKKITPTRLTYFLACISFRPIFGKLGIWYPKTWFWVPKSLLLLRLHDFLWKYFSSLRKRPFKTRSAQFEKNNWKNRLFFSLLRQTAMQNVLTLFKDFFSSIWSINESISSFSGIWSFSSLFSNSCHGMIHDSGRFHCSELVCIEKEKEEKKEYLKYGT